MHSLCWLILLFQNNLKKGTQKMDIIQIPNRIKKIIGTDYTIDQIGMSSASVLLFQDKVLKIREIDEESRREVQIMEWLKGKIPVPEVLYYEEHEEKSYLLMSKISGEMVCEENYMKNPEQLLSILTEGLTMLWQTDISDCTFDSSIEKKLEMAARQVHLGLVDLDNVEPETFGEEGFKDPEELLDWLVQNKPKEEYVLSHGDFCLPNIFANHGKLSGFIDLSKMGYADKYQDIALCYRSLKHNIDGKYGSGAWEIFDPNILFDILKITPDWDKIKYYILLDELF